MDKYTQAVLKIIEEQKQIIGPIAVDLAKKTQGISQYDSTGVSINGDPRTVLESLVLQYEKLFGRASVEVSKAALKRAQLQFQPEEYPSILR